MLWKSLYSWIKKMSFTTKLSLSYLIVVFIPLTAGTVLFTGYVSKSLKSEYLNSVNNNLEQISYNMAEKAVIGLQVGKSFASDYKLDVFLRSRSLTDKEIVETINKYITSWISSVKLQNPSIYNVKILHKNEAIYDVPNCLIFNPEIGSEEWKKKLGRYKNLQGMTDIKYIWIYLEYAHEENRYKIRGPVGASSKEDLLSMPKMYTLYFPMVSSGTLNDFIGIVEVDIPERTLLDPILKMQLNEDDYITLVTSGGRVLYRNSEVNVPSEIEKTYGMENFSPVKLETGDYYLVKAYCKYLDSWIVQYVSARSIVNWNNFMPMFILGLVLAIITLGGISALLSRILVNNLMKLRNAINHVKDGDFNTRVDITSRDEVGELASNFNKMTDRINELLEGIKKANNAEKEAIYRSLENQIRPHFLCNALDAVRMTAETQDCKEISMAVETITNYFMYNLAQKSKYVAIDVEIRNVTDYIAIHNLIRKKGIKCEVKVTGSINGELGKFKILKFILQPIVENSIRHGFREMREDCYICLEISDSGGILEIIIEDNGVGISPERLEGLERYLDLEIGYPGFEVSNAGIGLRNIKERLKAGYGDAGELEIESYENVGTRVTFKMPLSKMEIP